MMANPISKDECRLGDPCNLSSERELQPVGEQWQAL
jgi:hypothetical protein